ncbi:hypothetical protein, partial [Klebsiella quasipneumoniae]|uniref:hypothetical protein n=1 Tax=Klebsiella quasipneumoniae TaxID=1463165 RepID=UPI002810C52F
MLYNCYIFICDCIHIFFRKHGFRDQRQRRSKEKVDYGEGIATTGFYVALNEDDELDMVGFSPEAVLGPPGRATGAWLHVGPVAPETQRHRGDIPHTAKNPAPFGTGFLLKRK